MKHTPYNAPDFALSALTVRGIGPYIHGARLEIRPLTIICGENGAGKSTWFKVLKVLRDSSADGSLPFKLNDEGRQMTNAFYRSFQMEEDCEFRSSPDFDHPFGPPGTIGLEFVATRDVDIQRYLGFSVGSVQTLWPSGCWKKGTKFRFRIANPLFRGSDKNPRHFCPFSEFSVEDTTIRFVAGPWLMTLEDPQPSDNPSWTMYLKRRGHEWDWINQLGENFLPTVENPEYSPTPEEQEVIDRYQGRYFGSSKEDRPPKNEKYELRGILSWYRRKLNELIAELLKSVFHVGALRDIETRVFFDPTIRDSELAQKTRQGRHVGERGQFAWWMHDVGSRYGFRECGLVEFSPEDFDYVQFDFDDPLTQKVFSDLGEQQLAELKCVPESKPPTLSEQAKQLLANTFNRIVEEAELFRTDLPEFIDKDEELSALSKRLGDLSITELRKLHSIALEHWFFSMKYPIPKGEERKGKLSTKRLRRDSALRRSSMRRFPWTSMTEYLSIWMNYLSGQSIGPFDERNRRFSPLRIAQEKPAFMEYFGRLLKGEMGIENSLDRVFHGCFGEGDFYSSEPPGRFSSGFHQLFPILVQVSAVDPLEVVTVENPEVHLHPSLIVKFSEYLIEAGNNNRLLMVETHSDLLVRRMVRSVIEEDVGQEDIRIYFVGLDEFGPVDYRVIPDCPYEEDVARPDEIYPRVRDVLDGMPHADCSAIFRCAKLEQIQFGENRRIVNWPAGFLDEETLEADRLLDAMSRDLGDEPDE